MNAYDVHEDTSQIQLDLETDVDVRAIDRRTPPEREPTVRDLVETGPLRVRELLVPHRLLEAGRLLPEQTLPGREVRALEEGVLENALDTSQSSDDIHTVVVELPQLAIMALRRPPEGIATDERERSARTEDAIEGLLFEELVLLPVRAHTPTTIIRKSMTVLLEQSVDTWDTTVPAVLKILERETTVLRVRLLPLH